MTECITGDRGPISLINTGGAVEKVKLMFSKPLSLHWILKIFLITDDFALNQIFGFVL